MQSMGAAYKLAHIRLEREKIVEVDIGLTFCFFILSLYLCIKKIKM